MKQNSYDKIFIGDYMAKASVFLKAGRPSAKESNSTTSKSIFDPEPTKRLNVEVSIKNHAKLKIYAAQQGKSVKEILTEFIANLPVV